MIITINHFKLIFVGLLFVYFGSIIMYLDFLSRLKRKTKFDKVIAIFPILRLFYLYLWVS